MRVLIVDDEAAFAEPLAQRLNLRGMDAAVAGDATQALAMLGEPWDIIFLDVCLPGMDGVSLLKIIRERCADVDVVMLSGATEMNKAVQAMRRGARNWLSKPVALEPQIPGKGRGASQGRPADGGSPLAQPGAHCRRRGA